MPLDARTGPVVLLGFDAADPDLVERWAREGKLPAMARLMARGTRHEPVDHRSVLVERRADPLADLLAGAEGAAHYLARRRRLRRERQRRIVRVRRPLAHL
jgi:hypothetical protein